MSEKQKTKPRHMPGHYSYDYKTRSYIVSSATMMCAPRESR